MIPLEIAVDLEYSETLEYNFFIVLTDLIFFVDIVIAFSTTLNQNNIEIFDRSRITKHYLKNGFTIDFLSAFPADLVSMLFLTDLDSK